MKTKNSKMGRPIKYDNPRDKRLSLRISEKEIKDIEFCAEKLGKTKIDTVMYSISKLKESLE